MEFASQDELDCYRPPPRPPIESPMRPQPGVDTAQFRQNLPTTDVVGTKNYFKSRKEEESRHSLWNFLPHLVPNLHGYGCGKGELWLSDGEALAIERMISPLGFGFALSNLGSPTPASLKVKRRSSVLPASSNRPSTNLTGTSNVASQISVGSSRPKRKTSSTGMIKNEVVETAMDTVLDRLDKTPANRRSKIESGNDAGRVKAPQRLRQSLPDSTGNATTTTTTTSIAPTEIHSAKKRKRPKVPSSVSTEKYAKKKNIAPCTHTASLDNPPSTSLNRSSSNTRLGPSLVCPAPTSSLGTHAKVSPLVTRSSRRRREVLSGCWEDACCLVMDRLEAEPSARWFVTPVDPEVDVVPEYFDKVACPMDFRKLISQLCLGLSNISLQQLTCVVLVETVRQKLNQGMYTHPFRWQEDIRTVFFNAFT